MEFKWMNESALEPIENGVKIYAPAETDFFVNSGSVNEEGVTPSSLFNAPYYHTEVTGDFVMRVKVSHDFVDTYDSSSVMVWVDNAHWAKACYEKTDFGTHAVVSVVTKEASDDANGCNLEGNSAWLQVTRRENAFAFHYSVDGEHFYMMRFFSLDVGDTVKVGLLAQCPLGNGGYRCYQHLTIEHKTVKNIREGK